MKKILFALSLSCFAQPASALECNLILRDQLMLAARSDVADAELVSTMARMFSKGSPVLVSGGFRSVVLAKLAAQVGVNNDYKGSQVRNKLRDFRVNREGFTGELERLGSAVLSQMYSDFVSGSPNQVRQKYSVRERSYEGVKANIVMIENHSRLRPLMVKLIGEVVSNSANTFIMHSYTQQARGNIYFGSTVFEDFARKRQGGNAIWTPFAPLFVSFYKLIGVSLVYQPVKNLALSRAVKQSANGVKPLALDKFTAPKSMLEGGAKKLLTLPEIEARFANRPSPVMLESLQGILKYDSEYIDTVYEFQMRQQSNHVAFLNPEGWKAYSKSFSNLLKVSALTPSDRSALVVSLQSLHQFVDRYADVVSQEQMVMAIATDSLQQMQETVEARRGQMGEGATTAQKLEKRHLDTLAQNIQAHQDALAAEFKTMDAWVLRLREAAESLQTLRSDLNPVAPSPLDMKTLRTRLKQIATELAIPGFSW